MTEILLLKLAHLLLFVYWLGGDLGVFYSSRILADAKQSDAARLAAARIMLAVDQAPRICMTLMLPVGLHLAWRLGLWPYQAAWVAVAWVVGLLWLGNVLWLHFRHGHAQHRLLSQVDFAFRVILIVALAAVAAWSVLRAGPVQPPWLAWKLLVFALLVGLGLLIRIQLRPFGPAFAQLAASGATDTVNRAIAGSLARCRPLVVGIWIGLLINAMLGLHLIGV